MPGPSNPKKRRKSQRKKGRVAPANAQDGKNNRLSLGSTTTDSHSSFPETPPLVKDTASSTHRGKCEEVTVVTDDPTTTFSPVHALEAEDAQALSTQDIHTFPESEAGMYLSQHIYENHIHDVYRLQDTPQCAVDAEKHRLFKGGPQHESCKDDIQILTETALSYEQSYSPGLSPSRSTPPANNGLFSPKPPTSSFPAYLPDDGLPAPTIYDPGSGPRVRDMRAFLASPYFPQPPAPDAEFAAKEVLEMLCTILPDEMAMVLWYNKSRASSRVCPACKRIYHLGDALRDPMMREEDSSDDDEEDPSHSVCRGDSHKFHADGHHWETDPHHPQLRREQEISGLCSPICFCLAALNYPGAIKPAWGRYAEDMDEQTWAILNGPGIRQAPSEETAALSMLVRMTRLHDLGLAQLCLGEDDVP